MPTISEISATTTSISMRVTPADDGRLILPADDIGIVPVPAGRAICAQADDVGFISVFARIVINIGMFPGVVLELLLEIRPLPVLHSLGLVAQRLQTLLGGGERAGIEFVGPQSSRISIDLGACRGHFRAVRLLHHLRQYQGRE